MNVILNKEINIKYCTIYNVFKFERRKNSIQMVFMVFNSFVEEILTTSKCQSMVSL